MFLFILYYQYIITEIHFYFLLLNHVLRIKVEHVNRIKKKILFYVHFEVEVFNNSFDTLDRESRKKTTDYSGIFRKKIFEHYRKRLI